MPLSIGPRRKEPSDLIDLLLECHGRIRDFVELARLAATRADLPSAEIVDACQRVERYFTQALPLHVRDEEDGLLPRLLGRDGDLDRALESMREQHGEHAPKLRSLLAASSALGRAPSDEALRASLATAAAEVAQAFSEHLSLEEAVIFPAVRRLLPAAVQEQLVLELRERRRR